MEIALHLGAHFTDQDALVRCLMRNRPLLLAQQIAVPGPGRYRQQLRQLAFEMRERETGVQTQELLLDGILDDDDVRRVVFSSEDFLSLRKWSINAGRFYHAAGDRLTLLRHLFPAARIELFLAIRNPATFLPALSASASARALETAMAGTDPAALRWSATIAAIREAQPDLPLTVWCDEDTPLLWAEVLRDVSGHADQTVLDGWLAWYWDLVTPKGHEAMRRWFAANPPENDLHRRKMMSALLARFARPEVLEVEAPLPGWSEATVEALSASYDEDLDLIAAMPGVTLLEP